MDCQTAHFLMSFSGPRGTELEASEAEALEAHLAACPACAQRAQAERRIDEHLGVAMRAVSLPEMLRGRLLDRMAAERSAVRRRRLLRAGASLAAAAAILLALVLGLDLNRKRLRTLDLDQLHAEIVSEISNPSLENVDRWLEVNRFPGFAPPDFNYQLLTHFYLTELQGKRVPLLLFTKVEKGHPRVLQARVYLLPASEFDVEALKSYPQDQGSGYKVVVETHPTDPRCAYLIVYTGDSLLPFLLPPERPAGSKAS